MDFECCHPCSQLVEMKRARVGITYTFSSKGISSKLFLKYKDLYNIIFYLLKSYVETGGISASLQLIPIRSVDWQKRLLDPRSGGNCCHHSSRHHKLLMRWHDLPRLSYLSYWWLFVPIDSAGFPSLPWEQRDKSPRYECCPSSEQPDRSHLVLMGKKKPQEIAGMDGHEHNAHNECPPGPFRWLCLVSFCEWWRVTGLRRIELSWSIGKRSGVHHAVRNRSSWDWSIDSLKWIVYLLSYLQRTQCSFEAPLDREKATHSPNSDTME